ncbi:MAG: hypothetical protein L3K03_08525 [Thermoplasmata archaeon]|nr:hypothetical protein [Thermoplasmata archaeon]
MQALVARELVEEFGVSSRRAADLLGLAPSAVSQYLSGKRLSGRFLAYSSLPEARRIARTVAKSLRDDPTAEAMGTQWLLQGASRLVEASAGTSGAGLEPDQPLSVTERTRELAQWARRRVRLEQEAVSNSMHLAQKARDELTRAIFRQIGSDSLRHADTVAALASYLDRGISRSPASGITRGDVEALIESERKAESGPEPAMLKEVGGTLSLLLSSMGADERKHDELLQGLLDSEFAGRDHPRSPRRPLRGKREASRTPRARTHAVIRNRPAAKQGRRRRT